MAFSTRGFGHGHRGGRGGRNFQSAPAAALPQPESSQKLLEGIATASMMARGFDDKIKIEKVEYVTSFNWKEARDPTILVPGKFKYGWRELSCCRSPTPLRPLSSSPHISLHLFRYWC